MAASKKINPVKKLVKQPLSKQKGNLFIKIEYGVIGKKDSGDFIMVTPKKNVCTDKTFDTWAKEISEELGIALIILQAEAKKK